MERFPLFVFNRHSAAIERAEVPHPYQTFKFAMEWRQWRAQTYSGVSNHGVKITMKVTVSLRSILEYFVVV
jgi:hypothetical protein